jgi:hypothetical protein
MLPDKIDSGRGSKDLIILRIDDSRANSVSLNLLAQCAVAAGVD